MLNAFRWTCILALICALGTAVATVRRVPEDYLAIQTALFNASNGDTVSVKPGTPQSPTTYSDSLNFKGSDSVLVAARDSVNAGIREISNPDPEATIIDANSMSTNVVKIADPLATINQAGIRGFTLKNGQAQTGGIFGGDGGGIFVYACAEAVIEKMIIRGNSGSSDGGGICIQSLPSGASVIIDSCRITDNTATSKGGGIASLSSSGDVVITNCTIDSNYAFKGGGIYSAGNDSIYRCVIRYDTASNEGGGIYCSNSASIVADSIQYCIAPKGGGIAVETASPTIKDNYIAGDTARTRGGGLYLHGHSGLTSGNTVKSNYAHQRGGAIYNHASTGTIRDNTIDANYAPTDSVDGIYFDGIPYPACTANTITNHTWNVRWWHTDSLNAQKNYWGMIDTDSIDAHIYDDDEAGGIYEAVDFDPIRFKGHVTYDSRCSTDVYVIDDAYVDTAKTLTVDPGMVLNFSSAKELIVNGVLVAKGTSSDTITFTSAASSPSEGDWQQITIDEGQTCTLSYCLIEYAECGLVAGCKFWDCNPVYGEIKNCRIRECETWGVGGWKADSSFTVSDCVFDEPGAYGIKFGISSSPKVEDNTIDDPDANGIYLASSTCSPSIVGNVLSADGEGAGTGTGILLSGGGSGTVLDSNSVHYFAYSGISLVSSSDGTYEGCYVCSSGSYGLICDVEASPEIHCFKITGGNIGILAQEGSYPILGDSATGEGQDNYIDVLKGDTALYNANQNPDTIKAEYCFWTKDGPGSDPIVGPVDYNPYLTQDPECGAGGAGGGQSVALVSIPSQIFRLSQNAPNPTAGQTKIRYHLPQKATVSLSIYNSLGQLVRTLVNEEREPGNHEMTWQGRDQTEAPVPSGIYFLRMEAGDTTDTKKMIVVR